MFLKAVNVCIQLSSADAVVLSSESHSRQIRDLQNTVAELEAQVKQVRYYSCTSLVRFSIDTFLFLSTILYHIRCVNRGEQQISLENSSFVWGKFTTA